MAVEAAARPIGLSRRFAAICGADTFGVSKPDPSSCSRRWRGRAAIWRDHHGGDAGPDVGVARRAGIP
jgi:phosphoglycolate phosphatase